MSTLGKYNEYTLEFAANQNQVHNDVGDTITFLSVSGAFTFKIDGGQVNTVRAGITFKMPEGETFKRITFNETAGSTGNILFAIARGNVVDARSVISGDTPILNAASPNDSLRVDLAATDAGILALKSTQTDYLRSALHDLTGLSYSDAQNTTKTFVTAASNTSGIILHNAILFGDTDQNCYLYLDDSPDKFIMGWSSAAGGDKRPYDRLSQPTLLPSGLALKGTFGSTSSGRIWYEVL